MNWQQVALAILVGAVIGYVTNWIAIRMLFRPLYERRLWGVRLPFTPGVIPRGKGRLAGGIGDVVGGMLLTEEKVVQHLLQPESEAKVAQHLSDALARAQAREATLGEALGLTGNTGGQAEEIARLLTEVADGLLKDNAFRENAANTAAGALAYLLEKRVGPTVEAMGLLEQRAWLEQALPDFFTGQAGQDMQSRLALRIEAFFNSPARVGDYLPEAVHEGLRRFIDDQAPRLFAVIEQYLNSPGARQALKERIDGFLEGTALKRMLNGVLSFLGSGSDMITQKISNEIAGFLADERNRAELTQRLHLLLEEVMHKSVAEITSGLDEAGKKEKSLEIAAWIVGRISSPAAGAAVTEWLEAALERNRDLSWRQLLRLSDVELREKAQALCSRLLQNLAEDEDLGRKLAPVALNSINALLGMQIKSLMHLLPTGVRSDPGQFGLGVYRFLVRRQVPGLMRFLDINNMVRRRVEELEVLQVEEMLLGIMRRELVAITWLGALLGAILGLVMVGMQHLAK